VVGWEGRRLHRRRLQQEQSAPRVLTRRMIVDRSAPLHQEWDLSASWASSEVQVKVLLRRARTTTRAEPVDLPASPPTMTSIAASGPLARKTAAARLPFLLSRPTSLEPIRTAFEHRLGQAELTFIPSRERPSQGRPRQVFVFLPGEPRS
jgi:hypothetical protein